MLGELPRTLLPAAAVMLVAAAVEAGQVRAGGRRGAGAGEGRGQAGGWG